MPLAQTMRALCLGTIIALSSATVVSAQIDTTQVRGTTAEFAGVWETVLPQTGSHYRLTLAVSGNSVTGEFINEENQTYNGTITGTANGARLDYTYTEPRAGVSGGGYFIVSAGNTLSGLTHAASDKTQYSWEGRRVDKALSPIVGQQWTVRIATTVYDQPKNGTYVTYLNSGVIVTMVSCGDPAPDEMCQISAPQAGWVPRIRLALPLSSIK